MKLVPIALVALSLLVGCSDQPNGGEMFAEEYPSGKLKARGYIKGKNIRTGEWTFWHENGQKESEGRYVDHQKVGDWKYWRVDGKGRQDRSYKNGQLVGGWAAWGEAGPLPQTYKEVLEHAIELHEEGNALDLLRFYVSSKELTKEGLGGSGELEGFAAGFVSSEKFVVFGRMLKHARNHEPVRSVDGNTVTLLWIDSSVGQKRFIMQNVAGQWFFRNR